MNIVTHNMIVMIMNIMNILIIAAAPTRSVSALASARALACIWRFLLLLRDQSEQQWSKQRV